MTPPRLPTEVRHAALVWAFQHLEDPLTAELVATLLQAHLARGAAQQGLVPELEEVDLGRCQAELQALEAAGLLYRRRLGGYQVTEAGMVLGRCMAEAAVTASPPILRVEPTAGDLAFLEERRRLEAEGERVLYASTRVPARLLEGHSPAELQAHLEALVQQRLLEGALGDVLNGQPNGKPVGLKSYDKPRRTA